MRGMYQYMKRCIGIVRTARSVYGDGVGAYHDIFRRETRVNGQPHTCPEVVHKEGGGALALYFTVQANSHTAVHKQY